MATSESFCGCCGGVLVWEWGLFCDRCRQHVGIVGPPENRTYFARTGEPCPFQATPNGSDR